MISYFLISLLLFINILTYCQVALKPLIFNPILYNNYKNFKRHNKVIDTLQLPFFDDFSYYFHSIYPDKTKWIDDYVYINNTFCIEPPSIGVATFDALNEYGEVYPYASTNPFIADILTSKPINLLYKKTFNLSFTLSTDKLYYYHSSSQTFYDSKYLFYKQGNLFFNCYYHPTTYNVTMQIYYNQQIDVSDSLYYFDENNSTWVYIERYIYKYLSPADSLYLSFFIQPKGKGGNAPDIKDSLVLQFKKKNNEWVNIRSFTIKDFDSTFNFKLFILPINDEEFFYNGFQFRFFNYCSVGSLQIPSLVTNVDYWNLDYVLLDMNRSISDTNFYDVSFFKQYTSSLKNNYTSIPWKHFITNSDLEIDTVYFFYKNLGLDTFNVKRELFVLKNNETIVYSEIFGNENIMPKQTFEFKIHKPKIFITDNLDSAVFDFIYVINYGTAFNIPYYHKNDTLFYRQVFYDYYSYDDGSSEYGIGLAGSGTKFGKFAQLFVTSKPDTLRGVYMYFNKSLNFSNQNYFYLSVWDVKNKKPNNLIYKKIGVKPIFTGINNYVYYSLDTSIYVKDSIFIGWIQTTEDFLNLGFDLNTDFSEAYYNISGAWNKIPFKGTPMIRAVIGDKVVKSENLSIKLEPKIFPNPTKNFLYIDHESIGIYEICDVYGNVLKKGKGNKIDVSSLNEGIYILTFYDDKNVYFFKFIKLNE